MSPRILLCGADEYIGRLFVAEAIDAWADAAFELVLSGQDAAAVAVLADQHGLAMRAWKWGPSATVAQQLADIDVVVNAAGPLADSSIVLAQAAIAVGCHCVDLSADVDVFRKLEPLAAAAAAAQVALVRSAGSGTVPSVLMVNAALRLLIGSGYLVQRCLGAVRLALQCVPDGSRSSAASAWRGLARDVTVVRAVSMPGPGGAPGAFKMRPDSVPVGSLERQFDFAVAAGASPVPHDTQIASAANLCDTVAAAAEIESLGELAGSVESYVSATTAARVAYPASAGVVSVVVPLAPKALVDGLASYALQVWPDGPFDAELRHTIVLQVEDEERTPIVDWRLSTPGFYLTGARCAVALAEALAGGGFAGLCSPAQVLAIDLTTQPPGFGRALRGCRLDKRVLG